MKGGNRGKIKEKEQKINWIDMQGIYSKYAYINHTYTYKHLEIREKIMVA